MRTGSARAEKVSVTLQQFFNDRPGVLEKIWTAGKVEWRLETRIRFLGEVKVQMFSENVLQER